MAHTPNDSWYYLAGEQPTGPLSTEELLARIAAGILSPQTLVRNLLWSDWCPASQVPGLLPNRPGVPLERPPAPRPAEPDPGAGPSPPPPPPQPTRAEKLSINLAGPNRVKMALKGKKRKYALVAISPALVAVLAVCIVLAFVRLNAPPDTPTPAKPPVARNPRRPAADELQEEAGRRTVVQAPRRAAPSEADERGAKARGRESAEADSGAKERSLDRIDEGAFNRKTFEILTAPTPRGRIDELVFAKWKEQGIEPANPSSDAVFLRRVYLDVLGTLPTVQEARTFLADNSPDKRKKLIDVLLERPEFADFWAMKWSDLLRVKSEFPINLWPNASQAYHRWIRKSIRDNLPYDKFVRELLTSSGSNFRVPQVNFYRALQSKDPKGIARAVALTFMGCRAEKWPEERLAGMSGFFCKVGYKRTGEWKEEIVIFDPHKTDPAPPTSKPGPKKAGEEKAAERKPKSAPPPVPVFPDGTRVEIAWDKDPRDVFADWLITPKNPWFARSIVNRIWYWLQGRGIVHEADDIRPDNPPSNADLLNWLAEELVKSGYDLKHIYRLILNSSTYQLSSIPRSKHPEAAAQFASYTVRRLEAEVIIDALNQITGTSESYRSIIPEPYTYIPETRRAIALPDGSITSSFLELFGRPPRDSGLESERNNRITAGQRLHLLNSSHIRNKLRDGPALKKLLGEHHASENVYLAILSRFPDDSHRGSGEDLAWTLINSTEFLFRH